MKTSNLTNSYINQAIAHEIDPGFAGRAGYIFQRIEAHKPARVLEVGCGRGFYIQGLSKYTFVKEIHGIDVSDTYLEQAKAGTHNDPRVKLRVASVYKLPYKDNSFDCIICSEVMEHLSRERTALKEMTRVLKPNGVILISVPSATFPFMWDPLNWLLMRLFHTHINKNIWWLAGIWADHERLYTPDSIQKVLRASSLTPSDVETYVHWCWPFSHFWLYGVGKNVVEILGVKTFSRFEQEKHSPVTTLLAQIMRFPSNLLDKRLKRKACMNIAVTARKN